MLVHGTGSIAKRWNSVMQAMAEKFTVYGMDRRGRGGGGDTANYALEREFEDVAAVVDSIDQPVNLVGHLFGGLCALGGALITKNIQKLLLYEPAVKMPGEKFLPDG